MKKLRYNVYDIGGTTIKDNETYILKDNTTLNNLVLSSTCLHVGQGTRGHSHAGQEEVYFFAQGAGTMTVDEEQITVQSGDIVLVPDGAFHRVINNGDADLIFNCVFDGSRAH